MIVQIILVQNIFLDEFSSRVQDRRKRFENQKEKEREEISSNLIWYEMWRISLVDRREHTWAHFLQKTHTLLGLSTLRKGLGCPEGVFSPTFHTRRCENIWPRFRKISRPRNSRPPPFSLFYLLSGNSIHGKRFFFPFFLFFFSFRFSSSSWKWKKCHPSKREKNTRQRSIVERKIFLIPITDCERQFRLLETLCHPKYLIGVKELNSSRGMRSTLVSGGNTGGQQYLIEFRNSVYVPGVPSALCKPTFSFLELKQRGEGWRLTPAKSVNHGHLENG